MPRLQPAGVLGRLFSSIFPKKLEVQVRSEELADGRIALTPVYLLAGQEVDSALLQSSASWATPSLPTKRFFSHAETVQPS